MSWRSGSGKARFAVALATALLAPATFGAAPASAGHASCGDTITADTTLDSDLVDCPGDGLRIEADNVVLDLNGHTIDGDGTGPGLGVAIFEQGEGIDVKNGTITGFDVGVCLCAAIGQVSDNQLRRLRISQNGTGVLLDNTDRNVLERLTVTGNSGTGIRLQQAFGNRVRRSRASGNATGIEVIAGGRAQLGPSSENVLVRNKASRNAGDGMVVTGSVRNRLSRNNASHNGSDGIELRDIFPLTSNDNLLLANKASYNEEHGIVLSGRSSGNFLLGNRTWRNREGIDVTGSSADNRLEENSAFANTSDGIELTDASDNQVTDNRAARNGGYGFAVRGSSADNRLGLNEAFANGRSGILVEFRSARTLLQRNRADFNGDNGIDVDNAETTLRRNRAKRNVNLGIEAVAGVTDGGGNRAADNGDPAQCQNVTCSP